MHRGIPKCFRYTVFPDEKNTTLINGMNTVNTSQNERAIRQNGQSDQRLWLAAYGLHHAWE